MKRPRLIVFGEALTDFIRTSDNAWKSVPGGACWNVARVASTLGVETAWAGTVSDDFLGEEILQGSAAAGLDLGFIRRVRKPPLLALVHQPEPPQYFFLGEGTADLEFDEALLPTGWQQACEVAHFGCISLVRPPLGARLVRIAEMLKAQGSKISFDPNYRNLMGTEYPALFEQMAGLADILKASDQDLQQIYPDLTLPAAVSRVRQLAPNALFILTRGAQGATLYTAAGACDQAGFEVAVADTVGAGDACIGGFLASLMTMPAHEAGAHLEFATATAATACTQSGPYAPRREEVTRLMAQQKRNRPHRQR